MSGVGSPVIGDQPGMSIDTSLGTAIERFHVIQHGTGTGSMQVGLCATANTQRDVACGVAFRAWPYVPQVFSPSGRPSTDVSTYDSARKKKLAVQMTGFTWFKVGIPLGGNDKAISPGNKLVPSVQAAGSVQALEAATLTASYASATIIADQDAHDRIIAKAYSVIHVPNSGASWPPQPGVGLDSASELTTSLTALTNAATYGYVFGRLGKV